MLRFAVLALLLTAGAVQAEGIGGSFCETLRKQYVACLYEAGERTGTGGYVGKCEKADGEVKNAHKVALAAAQEPLRTELKKAGLLWHDVTVSPLPRIGETPDAYKARSAQEYRLINSECDHLFALD